MSILNQYYYLNIHLSEGIEQCKKDEPWVQLGLLAFQLWHRHFGRNQVKLFPLDVHYEMKPHVLDDQQEISTFGVLVPCLRLHWLGSLRQQK